MKFIDDAEALITIALLLAVGVAGYVIYHKFAGSSLSLGFDIPNPFAGIGDAAQKWWIDTEYGPNSPAVNLSGFSGDFPALSANPAAGSGMGLGGGGGDAF